MLGWKIIGGGRGEGKKSGNVGQSTMVEFKNVWKRWFKGLNTLLVSNVYPNCRFSP